MLCIFLEKYKIYSPLQCNKISIIQHMARFSDLLNFGIGLYIHPYTRFLQDDDDEELSMAFIILNRIGRSQLTVQLTCQKMVDTCVQCIRYQTSNPTNEIILCKLCIESGSPVLWCVRVWKDRVRTLSPCLLLQ